MAKAADEHPDTVDEQAKLHLAARWAALDPSAKKFVEQVKADVASGNDS